MVKVVIIADDLAGAADTGLPFRNHGLSAGVALAPGGAEVVERWETLVLSAETRNLSETEAGARAGEAAERLSRTLLRPDAALPRPLLYKKIDSTLRGWIGREIGAMLDRLPAYSTWIVPSYPRQGRRMQAGLYTVHGRPLHETEFAREFPGGLEDARVLPFLERQLREQISFIGCDLLAKGPEAIAEQARQARQKGMRALLFDAFTDEALDRIVEAGERAASPILWAGSAGLANAMAKRLNGDGDRAPWPQPPAPSPVVIVAGSRNPATLRQTAFLKEHVSVRHLALRPDLPAPADGEEMPHYLVTFPPAQADLPRLEEGALEGSPMSASGYRLFLASRLGEYGARVIARSKSMRFVLTGGDIAAATCRHLKGEFLEIVGQVEEGMPLLRVRGGTAEGALAVTKAGGFGSDASLCGAFRALAG